MTEATLALDMERLQTITQLLRHFWAAAKFKAWAGEVLTCCNPTENIYIVRTKPK
jgi:hypothetical protein